MRAMNGISRKLCALFSTLLILLPMSWVAQTNSTKPPLLELIVGQPKIFVDGIEYPIPDNIFLYYSNIYIPADQVLSASGFDLGWEAENRMVIAHRNGVTSYISVDSNILWVGDVRHELDLPTLIYRDILYISQAMFELLNGGEVILHGELTETKFKKRDNLLSTYPGDDYRYPDWGIEAYNGITFVNRKHGMELPVISSGKANSYATLANRIAEILPQVQVYAVIAPTYSEFYAPRRLSTDQTSGIRTAYSAMSDAVMPINAVENLYLHGNEKLYFDTDHHWTQRGAYYAYQAFAANKGWDMPDISTYDRLEYKNYVGSLANFTKGTKGESIARSNPELLEKFIPKSPNITAVVYRDQKMTQRSRSVSVVNPRASDYATAFIGGDNPLTVMVNPNAKTNRKLLILKESFGNAFATWAPDDYAEVYCVDPRHFNGYGGNKNKFALKSFYDWVQFDDLVLVNYPYGMSAFPEICRAMLD